MFHVYVAVKFSNVQQVLTYFQEFDFVSCIDCQDLVDFHISTDKFSDIIRILDKLKTYRVKHFSFHQE